MLLVRERVDERVKNGKVGTKVKLSSMSVDKVDVCKGNEWSEQK